MMTGRLSQKTGSLSAHYENTILITDGEPEIFTLTESEIATGRWNQYLGRQTEA